MCPREVDALYVVVSYTLAYGRVIRPGLSLVDAVQLVEHLGHGAVFRSEGMSAYSRPVYPVLPRKRAEASSADHVLASGRQYRAAV